MAKAQPHTRRPAPRLYLATPETGDAQALNRVLREAVQAADIAAVLLRLKPAGERDLVNQVKAVVGAVQEAGAALILDGNAGIAAKAGADGSHLAGIETFIVAVEGLKPARIAGCGGLHTRHDAMLAAERGADYVMFGEPGADGSRPSFAAIVERIEWWSGLFEIPCVGYAATLDEVGPLVTAGADFVAVGETVWDDPRGPAAAVADAAARLDVPGLGATRPGVSEPAQ
jgi:thiamine-phosphate pyrophosphorylase